MSLKGLAPELVLAAVEALDSAVELAMELLIELVVIECWAVTRLVVLTLDPVGDGEIPLIEVILVEVAVDDDDELDIVVPFIVPKPIRFLL